MPRKAAMPGVDRRQQLLEVAFSIFAEQGFESTTTKEITEKAGVNQGLIYFYFESKADIFFATFEYHARLVLAQLDSAFDQELDEDLAADMTRLFRQIMTVLDTPQAVKLLRIMHQLTGSRPTGSFGEHTEQRWRSLSMVWKHLTQRLDEYLGAQVASGKMRLVNTRLAAGMIARTMLSSLGRSQSNMSLALPSYQEQAEMIVSLFCYGLLPRTGQEDIPEKQA